MKVSKRKNKNKMPNKSKMIKQSQSMITTKVLNTKTFKTTHRLTNENHSNCMKVSIQAWIISP